MNNMKYLILILVGWVGLSIFAATINIQLGIAFAILIPAVFIGGILS